MIAIYRREGDLITSNAINSVEFTAQEYTISQENLSSSKLMFDGSHTIQNAPCDDSSFLMTYNVITSEEILNNIKKLLNSNSSLNFFDGTNMYNAVIRLSSGTPKGNKVKINLTIKIIKKLTDY